MDLIPLSAVFAAMICCALASNAEAQGAACVTPQTHCITASRQPAGSPCRCGTNPPMMGEIVINGDINPDYPTYDRRPPRSQTLSNDDIDDDDGVLAGPRHHHRRPGGQQPRDDDD
jgi:hypothetical protein